MVKTIARPRCLGCWYWHQIDSAARKGECRRMPPALNPVSPDVAGRWPVTHGEHWCGEHATATEEAS